MLMTVDRLNGQTYKQNKAYFTPNCTGLAMLLNRQLLNSSYGCFIFSAYLYIFNNLNKNPQTNISLTFLTHNILGIGGMIIHLSILHPIVQIFETFAHYKVKLLELKPHPFICMKIFITTKVGNRKN